MHDSASLETVLRDVEALVRHGDFQAAGRACREVLAQHPANAAAWAWLGIVALQARDHSGAVSALRTAVQLQPADAVSWHHLSLALQELRQIGEAEACCRRSLALRDGDAAFWLQLGNLLFAQQRFGEAATACANSLDRDSQNPTAWNNYGAAQHVQKHWGEAQQAYEASLALAPTQFDTRMKLADVFERRHEFSEAECVAQALTDEFPEAADAWELLGRVRLALADQEGAVAALRRAVKQAPSAPRNSRLLQAMQYEAGIEPGALLEEHQRWARLYADSLHSQAERRSTGGSLRIGIVSADLGLNPVAHMVLPVLESLDKERCSLTCYFDNREEDAVTPRFRNAADQWQGIYGLPDEIVAQRVRHDGIDVLIDLMGHAGNRLLVFARRPAPVQITWFGYVGTTGMQAMDYLLADRFHVSPGEENRYVESVLRMPHGYACYRGPDDAPDVGELPALSAGHVTFGCFNNPAKWTPEILDTWSEILRRVPDSRLLLKYYGLQHPATQARFRREFEARSVEADRIMVEGWSPHRELLRAYHGVDLALDTQPACLQSFEQHRVFSVRRPRRERLYRAGSHMGKSPE